MRHLWKVPLYCLIASWVYWHVEIHLLARFAVIKGPDGSLSSNTAASMMIAGILFLAVIAVGGLVFFRRITRRALFCSATVMLALNAVFGTIAVQMNSPFWAKFSEWSRIVERLFYYLPLHPWIGTVAAWCAPYLFLLFGTQPTKDGNGLQAD